MTNKIIEAWNAQADHMNQWDTLSEDEKLAWAYKQALEDAAKAAAIHSQYPIENDFDRGYSKGSRDASERIRALKEQQHG